jgi:(E)-4-hydroxy-3-methylbut-2-enyl-diphosphate synthase
MVERRHTRQIHVGKVAVGGTAPISVQSMTTTKTSDVEGTLQQIYALAAAGCDIVRCTCNEIEAAEGLAQIVPRSPIPIIADIHHQYKMALAALEAGVHGLRLNPGNIRKPEHIKAIDRASADFRYMVIRPEAKAAEPVKSMRVAKDLRALAEAYLANFENAAEAIKVLRAVAK